MFDLLLFWEEAGVALAQGTVRPPDAGQPGDGLGEVTTRWPVPACARCPHDLSWPSSCHCIWVRAPLAKAVDLDLWAAGAQWRLPPAAQPHPCQTQRSCPETRGQPSPSWGMGA